MLLLLTIIYFVVIQTIILSTTVLNNIFEYNPRVTLTSPSLDTFEQPPVVLATTLYSTISLFIPSLIILFIVLVILRKIVL